MIRPDNDDISESLRNQLHSADNEGPHDDLADLAVGLHQRHQVFAIQLDHFARLTGARSGEHGTARKHVDFAGELTRSVYRDKPLGRTGSQDYLEPTCRDDKERHDMFPRLEEHLASSDRTDMAMYSDPLNLSRRQSWKDTLNTGGKRQGRWKSCVSHGASF
jgi:hypothetical protein